MNQAWKNKTSNLGIDIIHDVLLGHVLGAFLLDDESLWELTGTLVGDTNHSHVGHLLEPANNRLGQGRASCVCVCVVLWCGRDRSV